MSSRSIGSPFHSCSTTVVITADVLLYTFITRPICVLYGWYVIAECGHRHRVKVHKYGNKNLVLTVDKLECSHINCRLKWPKLYMFLKSPIFIFRTDPETFFDNLNHTFQTNTSCENTKNPRTRRKKDFYFFDILLIIVCPNNGQGRKTERKDIIVDTSHGTMGHGWMRHW